MERPTIEEAFVNSKKFDNQLVSTLSDKPFEVVKNKGGVGNAYEQAIGIPRSSELTDCRKGSNNKFGDVKTLSVLLTKTKGVQPKDSTDITMLQHLMNEVMNNTPWEECGVYKKIQQLLITPIYKGVYQVTPSSEWRIQTSFIISEENYPEWYRKLKEDYEYIRRIIQLIVSQEKHLDTINGPNNYLQVRTKGNNASAKTKNRWEGRNLSKNSAPYSFYFTGAFMKEVYKAMPVDN